MTDLISEASKVFMTNRCYVQFCSPYSESDVSTERLKSIPALKKSNIYNDRRPLTQVFNKAESAD